MYLMTIIPSKKISIYQHDKHLTLSDNINLIISQHNASIDHNNIAVFELFEHFAEGCTLFNHVFYVRPEPFLQ